MVIFHELRIQQRELLDQLDELEEAVVELTTLLESAVENDEEDFTEWHERLAWLYRQQAGVRVILGETERALLTFDE
jgi:chromosome segregation ATPase